MVVDTEPVCSGRLGRKFVFFIMQVASYDVGGAKFIAQGNED